MEIVDQTPRGCAPSSRPQRLCTPCAESGLIILAAAAALGGLGQSVAGAAGALLAERVAGPAAAGIPQAALVLGAGAAALGIGRLTAVFGRLPALTAASLVAVVGAFTVILGAAQQHIAWVVVGSLVLGAGSSAVMLARYAAAEGADPLRASRAMAVVLSAVTFGAVAGPALLAPGDALGRALGLPAMSGPYLLGGAAFAAMGLTLAARLRRSAPGGRLLAGPVDVGPDASQFPAAGSRSDFRRGVAVLAVANMVMVGVMTLAPVSMAHHGASLSLVGVMVSLHIAAMFGPSVISGWLVDRWGARRGSVLGGAALVVSCLAAAEASHASSTPRVVAAMALLGLGWNLCLIAGSRQVRAGGPRATRDRRESTGEAAMALMAFAGGLAAGPIVAVAGYPVLALVAAMFAALVFVGGLPRAGSGP